MRRWQGLCGWSALSLVLSGCLLLAGCQPHNQISPEIQAAREKLLLPEPPADPVLITEARKLPARSPIVVVGRLGVSGQPTWEPGKAMFVITDAHPTIAAHTHAHGDDDSDCFFCKRSKMERLAMVQVVDTNGEVLGLDGAQLIGASEGSEVVIRGTGEVNSLDMLVINAEGIYIK